MAAKEVKFSTEAREKMLRGIEVLADAVLVTLGATDHQDGVTVAKEIELDDKFENMGPQLVKEIASKTSYLISACRHWPTRSAPVQRRCSHIID